MSSIQNLGGFIEGIILPNNMEILISQYKDPYKPISIMKCHQGFERCSDHVSVQNDACFPCNPDAARLQIVLQDPYF